LKKSNVYLASQFNDRYALESYAIVYIWANQMNLWIVVSDARTEIAPEDLSDILEGSSDRKFFKRYLVKANV
jgi:hypothetical protein